MGGSVVSLLPSDVVAEEGGHGCHCSGCSGWLLFVFVVVESLWLLLHCSEL